MVNAKAILSYGRGKPRASLYFIGVVSACLLAHPIRVLGVAAVASRFAVGVLSWSLIEYLVHRFVHHGTWRIAPGRSLHLDHHANAKNPDNIGSPIAFFLLQYAFMSVVCWGLAGDLDRGLSFSAGLAMTYVTSECLHFWCHHGGKARSKVGRVIRRNHLGHHFRDEQTSFGLSSPVWDWVFGTAIK